MLFLGLSLIGCSINQRYKNTTCIQEYDTSNYAPNIQRAEWGTKSSVPAMPPWWEPQLDIDLQSQLGKFSGYDIAFQGNVMWIVYRATTREKTIIRYDMDTQEIRTYGIGDKAGDIYVAANIFETSDGILWVKGESSQDYSILARYDKVMDGFQVVMDQGKLFAPPIVSERTRGLPTQPVFGETADGDLIVALNGEIFTYNPTTNQATLVLDREKGENVNTIELSETGQIWFTSYNDLSIRMFDLEDGTLENYAPPPAMDLPYPNYAGSFLKAIDIDQQGRIWFLDYGMLELDENAQYVWQPIDRSTVFISINNPEVEYDWIRPGLIYHFSDGNMWFSSGVGGGGITVVQYDTEEDKWCWKATKGGPLAEDDNGNIWLVAGSQIFKYTSHQYYTDSILKLLNYFFR
jgi:ligand-binding sensor domain-containing protein